MSHAIAFKKVVEFERAGKRYRKVTSAEADKYEGAVRDTYESAPGVPSFGWFVAVDAKLKTANEPTATDQSEQKKPRVAQTA